MNNHRNNEHGGQGANHSQPNERERFNELLEKRKGISPQHSLAAFYLYVKQSLSDYKIKIGNLGLVDEEEDGRFRLNNIEQRYGIIIEHPTDSDFKIIVLPGNQTGIEVKASTLSPEVEDCILDWGGPVFISENCQTHNRKGRIRHRSSLSGKYVKMLEEGGQNG